MPQLDQSLPIRSHRPQIGLTFFAFVTIGANAGAGGVLLPSLGAYYNVDTSVLGFLFLAATVGYLIAAFSTGPLTEKLGLQRFLLLGIAAFFLGAIVLGFEPPFLVVLTMRLFIGVGMGIIEAGFNSYIAALPRSTSVINNLHAFYGVGALIGPVVASTMLAIHWGWNVVYLVWGILCVPLLIGCGWLFRAEQAPAAPRVDEASVQEHVLAAVIKLRAVWLATLFLFIYVGIEVSIGNWGYSFLTVERHQGALLAGWVVSGYWLGLTLGRFVLARFCEWLGLSIVRLIEGCVLIIVVGALLTWLLPAGWVAVPGLFLIGFGLGPIYPTIVALMPGVVPPRLLSGAIGFLVSVSILGIALFPWLAGIIGQHVGWWTLLPYNIGLTVVMLCVWLPLRAFPRQSSVIASSEEMKPIN